MESLRQFLEAWLVPVLKIGFDPLHRLLNALPPPVWRISVCCFLLVGTLWVLFLKREFVLLGSPGQERWRDLRTWIPFLVIPYLIVYLIF